jgi:transcriptional regulator with GAF, ATPase, and Fis domain
MKAASDPGSFPSRKHLFLSDETLESVMMHLANRAVNEVESWDEASVSLVKNRRVQTFGPTSQKVLELDQTQYDTGEGPCVECCRTGEEAYLQSTSSSNHWSEFSAEAAEKGIGSVFSLPLIVSGQPIGGLNLYSHSEDAKSPQAADMARAYTEEASVVLANADAHYSALDLINQLNEALETRSVIGQAMGILMGQEGLTANEAFDKLSGVSQNSNVKLQELAQRFVDSVDKHRDENQMNPG